MLHERDEIVRLFKNGLDDGEDCRPAFDWDTLDLQGPTPSRDARHAYLAGYLLGQRIAKEDRS